MRLVALSRRSTNNGKVRLSHSPDNQHLRAGAKMAMRVRLGLWTGKKEQDARVAAAMQHHSFLPSLLARGWWVARTAQRAALNIPETA